MPEEIVTAVINFVDKCNEEHQFSSGRVSEALENIVKLGAFMKNVNDCYEELNEIGEKLEALSQHMDANFEQLKSVLHDGRSLYKEVTKAASNLLTAVIAHLKQPGVESLEHLKAEEERNPPLEYAYKLETLLEHDLINPVKISRSENKVYYVDGLYSQLLFVEAYMNGLVDDEDLYGPERIQEMILEFHEDVDRWSKE